MSGMAPYVIRPMTREELVDAAIEAVANVYPDTDFNEDDIFRKIGIAVDVVLADRERFKPLDVDASIARIRANLAPR